MRLPDAGRGRSKLRPYGQLIGRFLFGVAGLATGVCPAQDLAVVSAASYGSSVSPESIVAVFGKDLGSTSLDAMLDSSGQLPTRLGGFSVTVAGRPAGLLFVSPTQVNLVVPAGTLVGEVEVIGDTADGSTLRGVARVELVSPALFSLDASGGGPGAILNATTGRGPPFMVETAEIPGADQRTRLSLFGAGLRFADSVDVEVMDEDGKLLRLGVEFAGPAPGFLGLDQVNAVLTRELDGAGLVSLRVIADGRDSNVVTTVVESTDRPTAPQPLQGRVVTGPVVFAVCSVIPGQPSSPCLAYPFDHEWSESTSPHGIAAYELQTAMGNVVRVAGDVTFYTEWRVQLGDTECSPEPSTQTLFWNVQAIDTLGNRSEESRFGVFEIGPCFD